MGDLSLTVNGFAYKGWKRIRVTKSIESISGGFELAISDRWNGRSEPWPIREEDICTITYDGTTLIYGFIDTRRISISAGEHELEVSGRDAAGMLVDCSAVLGSWQFKSIPLLTLCSKLAEPYGIQVKQDPSVTSATVSLKTNKHAGRVSGAGSAGKKSGTGVPNPPKKFSVDPGESAFEVMDRACRAAGVLPISDGLGGILLTRAGSAEATDSLIEGQNILAGEAQYDVSNRYATYTVRGQTQGTDFIYGKAAAVITGSATDAAITRKSRQLVIRPEQAMTSDFAQNRAQWEAKIRAARGASVSVTVQDWEQSDGTLWKVNTLVQVNSPTLGVNGPLLISQAVFQLDEGGTTTQLTLKRPDAYLPEPVVQVSASYSGITELRNGV